MIDRRSGGRHGGKLGLGIDGTACRVLARLCVLPAVLCLLESKPLDEHLGDQRNERAGLGLVDLGEVLPRNIARAVATLPTVRLASAGVDAVNNELLAGAQDFDVMLASVGGDKVDADLGKGLRCAE